MGDTNSAGNATEADESSQRKTLQRRKHKNSRLGCPQCKQKRVKCDETLPICKKCSSRGARCGYLDYSFQELDVIRRYNPDVNANFSFTYLQPAIAYHQEYHIQAPVHVSYPHPSLMTYPNHMMIPQGVVMRNQYPFQFDQRYHQLPHPPYPFPISHNYQQNLQQNSADFLSLVEQHNYYHQQGQTTAIEAQNQRVPTLASKSSDGSHHTEGESDLLPSSASTVSATASHDNIRKDEREENTIPAKDAQTKAESVEEVEIVDRLRTISGITKPLNWLLGEGNIYKILYGELASSQENQDEEEIMEGDDKTISDNYSPDSQFSYLNSPFSIISSPGVENEERKHDDLTVNLVPHKLNQPEFDLKKFPEYLGETMTNVFGRIYLLKEHHFRFSWAWFSIVNFHISLLDGIGPFLSSKPELKNIFLKHRGICMNFVLKESENISDTNIEELLIVTTRLSCSSIFIPDLSMKDYFLLSSGLNIVTRTAFEKPEKFPNSFMKLKVHADGQQFLSKYVWMPQYNVNALDEFLSIVQEFGQKYLSNEDLIDDDDILHEHYENLVDLIKDTSTFLKKDKSKNDVLGYSLKSVFQFYQRWYSTFPSEMYCINKSMPELERVFYVFWNTLTDLLDAMLVGSKYIFTFSLNGHHILFPYNPSELYHSLKHNKELVWYFNYSVRITAFLNRRRSYIMRNIVLNDPIPDFLDNTTDRFKSRSLDIHEKCIAKFATTRIKKIDYPSELSTTVSSNITKSGDTHNYYKSLDIDDATNQLVSEFGNMDNILSQQEEVDMLDINTKTFLLNSDYDPRYTDPIFEKPATFQDTSLELIDRYINDRKQILMGSI